MKQMQVGHGINYELGSRTMSGVVEQRMRRLNETIEL